MLSYFSGILTNLSSHVIIIFLKQKLYERIFVSSKRLHKKKLKETLHQMPFIYREIDSDVLEDYVETQVVTIDMETMQETKRVSLIKDLTKLNHGYKTLFLGNAGIGKSTFFRHSVLSIINKDSSIDYLNSYIGSFPVFIFLKSVRNYKKSPIVNYILTDIPYFKKNGLEKLIKLARKRELFLLLDGYDEIGFVGSKNYIRDELQVMFSHEVNTKPELTTIVRDYLELYKLLALNRVWLSTREEFYRINPIDKPQSDYSDTYHLNQNYMSFKLAGLGDNRLKLVEKIFNKYRKNSSFYVEVLDEENFIQEIDTQSEDELVQFSKRPLFLVILCYIYINNITGDSNAKNLSLNKMDGVIQTCLDLLLTDLDKSKVRGLSKKNSHRKSFLIRRGDFKREKKDFLRSFSIMLFFQEKAVFTIEDIKEHYTLFFEQYQTENLQLILESSQKSKNPDFILQLIYSEIFVLTNFNTNSPEYDFPHRRFKEVLAFEALDDYDTYCEFKRRILQVSMSEFVQFVFSKSKNFREKILELLFDKLIDYSLYIQSCQLILNCLNTIPTVDYDQMLAENVKRILKTEKEIFLTKEFLNKLEGLEKTENVFIAFLHGQILNSNFENVIIICDILFFTQSYKFKEFIEFIDEKNESSVLIYIRKKYSFLIKTKSNYCIYQELNKCFDPILALVLMSSEKYSFKISLTKLIHNSTPDIVVLFLKLIKRYDSKRFNVLIKSRKFERLIEVIDLKNSINDFREVADTHSNTIRMEISLLEDKNRNVSIGDFVNIREKEIYIRNHKLIESLKLELGVLSALPKYTYIEEMMLTYEKIPQKDKRF